MKRKILFTILTIYFSLSSFSINNESNLLLLDNSIKQRSEIQKKKQKKISLYISLLQVSKGDQLFRVYTELHKQYISYRLDSAMYYAQASYDVAKQNNNEAELETALMNIIEVEKKFGHFQEALDMLKTLNPESSTIDRRYYYHLYHSINYLLYLDAFTNTEKLKYKNKTLYYLNLLLKETPINSSSYACNKSEEYCLKGESDKALSLLSAYIKKNPKEVSKNSNITFRLAETYHSLNRRDLEEYYLTLTSILDLSETKKEYMALQQLAVLLYKKGDISRAYNYITCSMEDIVFCHARCRMSFVSEVLPIISATYGYKMQKEARLRTIFILVISILLLFFVVVYVKLRKRNHELVYMHESLDNRNEQLLTLNNKLATLNNSLSESNRIKEEYIVQLFDLCSSYINKQKESRISMNRKIIAGKINEVRKELNETSMEAEELKAFFHHFDEIFLKLFPHFIQSFKKIMIPGKEIKIKGNELLSPELRIYALIRLGITDNSKIAELLHYSVQTVYNYRQRVRNRLSISKNEFMDNILHLC